MRRFGLLLGIFLAIAALGAMWSAARLVKVRGSWQKKYADSKAKAFDSRKALAAAEKEVDVARDEFQRAVFGWERFWNGVPVTPAGPQGSGRLEIQFGTNQGLQATNILYLFQPAQDGSSYVGPFRIAPQGLQEARALLIPNWRFRPGDDANWRFGQWRIRSAIPRPHRMQMTELEMGLLRKDELLAAETQNRDTQLAAKKSAEEQRDLRIKELKGNPDLEQRPSLNRYMIVGLQQAVTESEAERNAAQQEVDQLRRDVKRTNDLIQKVTADNERLAKQQPGGAARTASKTP